TYSDILDVFFKSFYTIEELEKSMDELKDFEILLIDTAGRSPKDLDYMEELNRMMEILKPTHVFLLLSLTMNLRDAMKMIEIFSKCDPTHIILTKMDEADNMSNLFNISFISEKPISHITNGQNIPDDIEEVDSRDISEKFLKEVFENG
ncbi:MAG TPA: flagellar biosynthesis protein FlhF, partial [Thermotogales bacterium]|nr:flagellar biosynthesis protein FlhF [Thermotogales bacterium]